jgi:hypothetical protein
MAIGNRADMGRSPYKKYGKAPYQYSETYRRWRAAVMAGRDNEARAFAAEHQKKFVRNPNLMSELLAEAAE